MLDSLPAHIRNDAFDHYNELLDLMVDEMYLKKATLYHGDKYVGAGNEGIVATL